MLCAALFFTLMRLYVVLVVLTMASTASTSTTSTMVSTASTSTASTMAKGKKSHYFLNTSMTISRLNTLVRGKIVFVELAGWLHDALARVQKDQTKPWMFHCMEGRSDKFTVPRPEDQLLLKNSPIDPAWIQAASAFVVTKFQELVDIVTDGGVSVQGRVVGIFEGAFGPKEEGPARKARDCSVQKSIDLNQFTAAQSVPDCMTHEIMREFRKKGWEFTYYKEGEATAVAQFRIADFCIMTSDDIKRQQKPFNSSP